jgi:hypothetical protein
MMTKTLVLALGACALTACIFDDPDVGGVLAGQCDPADSNPAVAVSYSRDLRPLFDRSNADGGCGCHNPGGPGVQLSGFDMSSLSVLRRGGQSSGRNIVVEGDPCASVLVQKLGPAPAIGARMPMSGPPFFTPEQIQQVADWIAEGAQDN